MSTVHSLNTLSGQPLISGSASTLLLKTYDLILDIFLLSQHIYNHNVFGFLCYSSKSSHGCSLKRAYKLTSHNIILSQIREKQYVSFLLNIELVSPCFYVSLLHRGISTGILTIVIPLISYNSC
jgi:hypothetical protein